jgi:twitching motility protein PilJ
MNRTQSNPSPDIDPIGTSAAQEQSVTVSRSLPTLANNFIRSHLVETIAFCIILSLILIGESTWNVWAIYRNFTTVVTNQFKLQSLSGEIVHLDEVLTMSARMAASTGDVKWEKRYRQFEPELDSAIKQTTQLAPQVLKGQSAQTDTANAKLVEFENRAFTLVRQGKREQAFKILLGQDYDAQKQIYAQGIHNVIANINTEIKTQLNSYRQRLLWAIVFAAVTFPILLLSWLLILSQVRTYIHERKLAQDALLDSQQSLLKLNQDLEAKVEEVKERTNQLSQQEQATKQENEVLQTDVSHILDIVSAVEAGDLTVEAQVSDRATGLVADTLNRLIEELGQTLAQVFKAAQNVSQGATSLEELAKTVASNAQEQAQEAAQVLNLTQYVETQANSSALQVKQANQSLLQMHSLVEQGQTEIGSMNQGIEVLQQGTDRMVQHMEALGDFVSLADQFAQEQNQIASLTQTLAMSATLLSARAAEQKDPRQFLGLAREFGTIAEQVKTLANQTNDSLGSLQKRTQRVQAVVYLINGDVKNLAGLVSEFTTNVEQSERVFSNVRAATGQVVQVGEAVVQSNQEIMNAAQSTASAMHDITALAIRTAQLTQQTQRQTESMEIMSGRLLNSIRFFQFPEQILNRLQSTDPELNFAHPGTVDDTNSFSTNFLGGEHSSILRSRRSTKY